MSLFKKPWRIATAVVLAASANPISGVAQQCPAGVISTIEIERLDVFELQDFEEGSFLRGVFRTANKLHWNTSESYIRSDILFEEGDCFDPFLLEESARILRGRPFIKWAEVTSQSQPDGNVTVHVQVQDDWTLEVGLGLSFDEGINLEEVLLQEANLLGRGMTVGVGRTQAREVLENFLKFGATRLFGTSWTMDAKGGTTRQGPFIEEEIAYPFTNELGRLAGSQELVFREDYFPYSTSGVENPTHVMLPYRRLHAQLTVARRFGEPKGLWVLGGGLSREELEFPDGLDSLRIVEDGEFGDLLPATEAEMEEVRSQTAPLSATRLNVFGGIRRIEYVLREGLDGVTAPQDVMVGTELTLSLNPSLPFLGPDDDAEDLHGRVDFFWASAPGRWVFSIEFKADGRYVWNADAAPEGWRDILTEGDIKAFFKPEGLARHTFFGRLAGVRTWNMDRPFQLTGGGREGVRGYSQDAFPGGRRILASLEDRFPLLQTEVADLGMAVFGDLGKVFGQDVPYGVDSGWRSSLGVGLRVNLPGGALRTMRVDFTLPLSGDRDTHGVYFRLYTELGGLLQVPKRPSQAERSRWSGIDTDMTVSRSTGG